MGRTTINDGCGGIPIDERPFLQPESSPRIDGEKSSALSGSGQHNNAADQLPLMYGVWRETKKLWYILGPSMVSRGAAATMNLVSQAYAGHLGEVELAALSISVTAIVGFNFSLLLGMASALQTLCGQAFGARRYHMLGIYLQRSFIILFICCLILLPVYIFAAPLLRLLGQPDDVAELTGELALWLIPLDFSYVFSLPLNRFFQSQLKTPVIALLPLVSLAVNVAASWLCTHMLGFGVFGLAVCLDLSWWIAAFGLLGYATLGGCPLTWTGWSAEAFSGLWEFLKLSVASGVMLCLENWYYRMMILMTGFLHSSTTALDALSICMNINGWEMTIPLSFLAATGVRVANELGAGDAKAAKFAMVVSVVQSTVIGLIFCVLVLILRGEIGYMFTSSADVIEEVGEMSYLLAATILLNSVQPVLSGVAVGSGWQATVAYINLGCYYVIGLPLGLLMGWVFQLSVMGIWGGMMLGGTAVQTAILAVIVIRCDWDNEAEKARSRVAKWSSPPDSADGDGEQITS